MTATAQLSHDLKGLGTALARAEAEVAAGNLVDLTPLEAHVGELCARLSGLSPAEAETLRPRMLALFDDFDRLTRTLETTLEEVRGALGGTTSRKRAIGAYGKTAGGGPDRSGR